MPLAQDTTATPSLRERRRAVAVREILETAERHIVEQGPHALSLRAVARSLGMTVQALYHYFSGRDALVTALITKAYDDLADAVLAAAEAPRGAGEAALPPIVVAAEGYRGWALAHPERFQLIYGAPMRHYEAPTEGSTTLAVRRMSGIFARELFAGVDPERLAGMEAPPLSPEFRHYLTRLPRDGLGALPPAGAALMLSAWGHLHGLVALEVFGHTTFLGDHRAEIFRTAMRALHEDVQGRIPPAA